MVQTRTGPKTGVISVEDYVAYIMVPGRTLRGDKLKPPTPEHLHRAIEHLRSKILTARKDAPNAVTREYMEKLRLLYDFKDVN